MSTITAPPNTVVDALTDKSAQEAATTTRKLADLQAQLDALSKQATEHKNRADELEKKDLSFKGSIKKILGGQGTEADARTMLSDMGYGQADIDTYIKENYGKPGNSSRGRAGGDDAEDSEENPEVSSLKDELASQREAMQKETAKRVQRDFDTAIEKAVRADPVVQALIKQRQALDKTVDAEKIIESFKGRASVEARKLLQDKKAKAGSFDETWIPGEVTSAVTNVTGELKGLIGDPKFLGRSPDSIAEEEALRNTKPVPPPTFKPDAADPGKLEKDALDYLSDGFSRMAEAVPGDITSA